MQAHTPRRLIAFTRPKSSPLVVGGLADWRLHTGIVECCIQPTKSCDRLLHHCGDISFVGDVATEAYRLPAAGEQTLRSGAHRRLVDIRKSYGSSGLGEGSGGRKAHARGGRRLPEPPCHQKTS